MTGKVAGGATGYIETSIRKLGDIQRIMRNPSKPKDVVPAGSNQHRTSCGHILGRRTWEKAFFFGCSGFRSR